MSATRDADGAAEAQSPHLFLSENGSSRTERLERINAALMRRVERSMDHQGNAYTLFQAAIVLEEQVRVRTDELSAVLRALEVTNRDLVRANEAAERSNASKTRFLAAASHDLLQPLNAARLAMAALAEEETPPSARRLIDQIDRSMTNVEELLRSLFVISKLDAGVTPPEREPVPLLRLCAAIENDFAVAAARKGLRFRIRALDCAVDSDPIFLRRILQNLVSNAVRYTRHGGVLVACRRRGEAVRIEVRDTGPGIPEDQQGKIFDEFFRGAAMEDTPSEGLGLGLAIVRRMAEALAHPVDFHSAPGRGAMFAVTAPLAEPVASTECEAMSHFASAGFAGATLAVIENDADAVAALEALLARWSCRTASATSGRAALRQLGPGARPDLVIADYHLDDGETGLDAVALLRAEFGASLPAIVVTADYKKETAAGVKAAGCEMLTKPVAPAELRALIAHLLSRRS
jgi:signal transduction histidine kinase/CheY-like chemotaxis protein